MIPQKRLLAGLISVVLTAASSAASAQTFLGSSVAQAQRLLPEDAQPETGGSGSDTLIYRNLRMGEVVWSEVTLRFDARHRLSSLSLRTRDLGYDALKARAQAQLQLYAADQVSEQATLGTVGVPAAAAMQIRLCAIGDEVEMTYEREASEL